MATASITTAVTPQTFLTIESELNQVHFERAEVVRSLLLALLAQQHVVLLGPPGTGKSRLVRDVCQRIVGTFFEWQLTRMSTPEELYGPISLQGLQQDRYRRIATGKLPEADIAYIDETFKASSAILNTMLAVMNERIFYNDGQALSIPLQMLVGASNELPDDREELGALWDRFLIRHVVGYVKDAPAFLNVLRAAAHPSAATTITLTELAVARQAVQQVAVDPVFPLILQLRTELSKQGIVVSDRRWNHSIGLIQAQAWLNGHTVADGSDVTVLQHVLWEEPDQRLAVAKAVMMLISPYDQEAQDILDEAKDAYLQAMAIPDDDEDRIQTRIATINMLGKASNRLKAVRQKAVDAGKPAAIAQNGIAELQSWGKALQQSITNF